MAFSDNLEGLKKLVSDFAQAATSLTKKAASATKTNVSLISEQERQKKAYLELGKLYYRDFITGEEPDEASAPKAPIFAVVEDVPPEETPKSEDPA